MALSNNIENILGAKIPKYVREQIETRIQKNSLPIRDNKNLTYLANKTGFIRIVSSVNIKADKNLKNNNDKNGDNTAKNYILFAGTSAYKNNTYTARYGIGDSGAYGVTGIDELVNYGVRPMPGIKSARIVSQGKLGSVRAATINFTVNDKKQLDIIDQLYFRPGYSILIEWGNTYYYKGDALHKGEDHLIKNPFDEKLDKDELMMMINQSIDDSQGNYDGMFGIITNFNFSFNRDGSFDCTLVAMGLGVLGDSVRINNSNSYPGVLEQEIRSVVQELPQYTNAQKENTDVPITTAPIISVGNINLPSATEIPTSNISLIPGVSELDIVNVGYVVPTKAQQEQYIKKIQLQQAINESINTAVSEEAAKYPSFLQYMLKAMQLHCFNIAKPELLGQNQLDTTGQISGVYEFKLTEFDELIPFTRQLFSNGALSFFFDGTTKKSSTYQINAKYGFSKSFLELGSNSRKVAGIGVKPIDLKDIMKFYIVTSRQDRDLFESAGLNYPSYIPLSFFLMIINHGSLLYEPKSKSKKSIFYVDFNPYTNLCLTNPQMLSTNPYKFLIPFEGGKEDYAKIFRPGDYVSGSIGYNFKDDANTPMWDPNTDSVSGAIPPFRRAPNNGDKIAYRGRIMNVLVSVDYLLDTIASFTSGNEQNIVNLKEMLERILSDMSKCLGAFNALRLAYSDKANCFYISDDQVIPPIDTDKYLSAKTPYNDVELPLYGKTSIAEDLRLQTDMSTKLSSYLAISANSETRYQSTSGLDSTPLGIYNVDYIDRYKPVLTANDDDKETPAENVIENKATINSSVQFNAMIQSFFSTGANSQAAAESLSNFYIERMSKLKAKDIGTQASMLIPVSLDFTTDGISGFGMGQAFTVSDEVLPYSYTNRQIKEGKKVGFIVTKTEQIIEANRWKTNIKGIMYYLKDYSKYASVLGTSNKATTRNRSSSVSRTVFSAGSSVTAAKAKASVEKYLGRTTPISDEDFNALIAATYAEAGGDATERTLVMSVILNRVKNWYGGTSSIIDVLTKNLQFEAVTGNPVNPGPSSKYVSGPNASTVSDFYTAANNLNTGIVSKKYYYFTAASDVYNAPGRDNTTLTAINNLKQTDPSSVDLVGKSWFTTKYWK